MGGGTGKSHLFLEAYPECDCGRTYQKVDAIDTKLKGAWFSVNLYYCRKCKIYSWANRQRKTREEINEVIEEHKEHIEELTDFIQF